MLDLTKMDWTGVQATAALITGVIALVTTGITAVATYRVAAGRAKVDRELAELKAQLDNKMLYAAEDVAHALMQHSKWRLRSFNVIKVHLGGFLDDELRKILVRAGAIRFEAKSGSELWGLLDRNRDLLGVTQVPWDPENPSHRSIPSWLTQ